MNNNNVSMAGIIGRYEGFMKIYSQDLKHVAELYDMDDLLKSKLELIASRMEKAIVENQAAWDSMFQPETDLVELERA